MIDEERAKELVKKWEPLIKKLEKTPAEISLELNNAVIIESREKWILCKYYDGIKDECMHPTLVPIPNPMSYENCMKCSERD
jgi:hypothetical protein